jgi:hypothetical protein
MADEFKKSGLLDGLGENDEIERWITVKGNHVPIKKGQTPKQAIEQAFDKPKKTAKVSAKDNIRNMGVVQLKKSIRSLEKQIKVHEEKIRNSDDIGLIQHWRKEIKKFANEILKYENELKKRGH